MSWSSPQSSSRPAAKGRLVFTCRQDDGRYKQIGGGDSLPENRAFGEAETETVEYTYPLKLILPQHASSSNCRWVYPVTFGGGLVEGDNIALHTKVGDGTAVLITTQSATKVFHCLEGKTSQQSFQCDVGHNALLAVLPDPVVCFQHSKYKQEMDITLSSCSANLILLDWLSAGRVARGELWEMNSYSSSIKISLGEDVVFRDAMTLGDLPNLNLLAAMKNYQVLGTLILLGPQLSDVVRSVLDTYAAVKPYGSKYQSEELLSVSPLKYKNGKEQISGCYLRIAVPSTTQAFRVMDKILQPLKHILGGDPFEHKF